MCENELSRSISVTQIGEYVRFDSCDRRFRLDHDQREEAMEGVPNMRRLMSPMDPVLREVGREREEEWAQYLRDQGLRQISRPEGQDSLSWERFLQRITSLSVGQEAFAREVEIEGSIGAFTVSGQIDFLALRWRDRPGRPVPYLLLVEGDLPSSCYRETFGFDDLHRGPASPAWRGRRSCGSNQRRDQSGSAHL